MLTIYSVYITILRKQFEQWIHLKTKLIKTRLFWWRKSSIMATGVPKIQLNDGNLMPAIGLGTFQGSYDYTVCIFNWYPFRRKGIFASCAQKQRPLCMLLFSQTLIEILLSKPLQKYSGRSVTRIKGRKCINPYTTQLEKNLIARDLDKPLFCLIHFYSFDEVEISLHNHEFSVIGIVVV